MLYLTPAMRKDLYNDLFKLEDKHWWHISKRRIVTSFIRKYAKRNDLKILDIGCGTGKNLDQFREFGQTYGLDSSPDALTFCKKRGLKNLMLGKAEKTPYKNDSFDIITILDVLEHTDDIKTIKEINRILKTGGILIATVPAFNWLWSRWDEILHHRRRYAIASLAKLLISYKFHILKISYMYAFLLLPVLIIRMIKSFFLRQNYSSDFKFFFPYLNLFLEQLANVESFFVKKFYLPFGLSIIVVAKKND